MKKVVIACCVGLALLVVSGPAFAQLKFGVDYTTSDAVYSVTDVKVKQNMIPDYLQGIQQTWMASNEVAKQLGHIEDYTVYVSVLPASGDYNMQLVIKYKDMAQYEKGRTEFKAFEDAWRKKLTEEKQRSIAGTYPDLRVIVGEYLMRQVQMLK